PAVTPWTTTLDGVGGNNPGIRLVSYNKNTGDLTDVNQYYSNLALANIQGSPLWGREYSLRGTFNLSDASPASLQNSWTASATVHPTTSRSTTCTTPLASTGLRVTRTAKWHNCVPSRKLTMTSMQTVRTHPGVVQILSLR
ncbi:PREDICTED: acid sphingomyelinase-like phosphodiesterase 3b, partial [Branchiostoma belcheri]|uniref:Acid sphingomyelinase-like phosphodiesterase 3b n=1 Tax=Branchiostoma belcheri TaxID=7741 RepID=A0A6P4YEP1_BRABE